MENVPFETLRPYRRRHRWLVRQLPNMVTCIRILAPFAAWACYSSYRHGQSGTATIWFALTALLTATDVIDGPLARRLDAVSNFGALVDPLLDKAVAFTVMGFFAAALWHADVPAGWFIAAAVMMGVRILADAGLILLGAAGASRDFVPGANRWGKRKFFCDCATLAAAWLILIWANPTGRWLAPFIMAAGMAGACGLAFMSIRQHVYDYRHG